MALAAIPSCSAKEEPELQAVWSGGVLTKPRVLEVGLTRFEDPGRILVTTNGPVCGESQVEGRKGPVTLSGSEALPPFADNATVILNGWRLRYLQKDHEVRGVGAVIGGIGRQGNELTWTAKGNLFDRNFDDPFEFCYVYTIVAWNSVSIDAAVDNADVVGDPSAEPFYNRTQSDGSTALVPLASYRKVPEAADGDQIAILPRGFFHYVKGDRHLLQLSHAMDHSEVFVEQGKRYGELAPPTAAVQASRRTATLPTWETIGIFKDNARARFFGFAAQQTPLWGRDVLLMRPPFSVRPGRTPRFAEGCVGASPPLGTKRESVEIRDLPFDYAIPLLTGWDLDYVCGDEHVTELGVWLENVEFTKKPGSLSGTLAFTVASVLRDKDSKPAHESRYKVDVLGLNLH